MRRLLAIVVLLTAACGQDKIVFSDPDPWKALVPYPGVGAGKAVVTNSGDDSITLYELSTLQPVARVAVGQNAVEVEGPHHVTAHAGAPYYFVGLSNNPPLGSGSGPHGSHGTGSVDGYVLKLSTADNHLIAQLRVDRNPGDVRLTPDGKTLLVSHFDLLRITEVAARGGTLEEMDSRLAIIDAEKLTKLAMIALCPAAHGIAMSADGKRAYVTCYATDELAVVALDDPQYTVTKIPIGVAANVPPNPPVWGPYAVTVSPVDGTVWVSCQEGQAVRVVDPVAGRVVPERSLSLAPGPAFFSDFNGDGSRLYVPQQGSDTVIELDVTQTPTQIVNRFPLATPGACVPHAVRFADPARLVVVCEHDRKSPGALLVLDPTSGTVMGQVATGLVPDDFGIILP